MTETLPARIPVFPLAGALLLPRARLPLNIFEPRYLAMVRDAFAGPKVIGMIQPLDPKGSDPAQAQSVPALYDTGCAGRVTECRETPDGRYLIALTGLCRFRIAHELECTTPYRQVVADYGPFSADLAAPRSQAGQAAGQDLPGFDREELLCAVERYVATRGLEANWAAIRTAPTTDLVDAFAMMLPFAPCEKQALLEAPGPVERLRAVVALVTMAETRDARRDGGATPRLQ